MPNPDDYLLPLTGRVTRGVLTAIPARVWRLLGGNPPVNQDGATLAPEIAGAMRVLDLLPGGDFTDRRPHDGRKQIREEGLVFAERFAPFAIVEDLSIPGDDLPIPATRYRARHREPTGLIVYFHGGGWVLGDRISTDSAVRFLATHTGADVLSIDYRLAPEHPFPAAIDDGLAAYRYALCHCREWGISPDSIVVAGDSAGANIAAVLAQEFRRHEFRPRLQVLFCPAVDLANETASYDEFADGYFLTRDHMDWYKGHYLPDPLAALDPRASPALADDLTGLPPAYIGVAGFDPLRDEGIAYATALEEAGNTVTLHVAETVIHPYLNITGFSSAARHAALHGARAIRIALGTDTP